MKPINGIPRRILLAGLAAAACLAIAACGSSSSSGSGGSATPGTTATSASAPAGASAARTKLEACLKQHGVTLPSRPGGFRPGGTGTGTTPGAARPGGGFFGGGGARRGRFFGSKTVAALKACGAAFGAGRFGRGAGGFRAHFSAATLKTFAACVKKHGYTLPAANTSGKGGIYPISVERDKKFQVASKACANVLRTAFRGSASGAGSAGTSTNASS